MYNYPKNIIPHYLNKHIRQEHVPHHAYFVRLLNLGKKTPSNKNEIHNDLVNYVKADEFADGMSVYLLDIYKPQHSRFKINDESKWLHNPWIKGDCNCPQTGDYKCVDKVCYVLIPVKQIKRASFDVGKFIQESFSNDNDLLNKDIIIESLKKITLRYEHAPTLCNFWHFNIFMYDINGKKIDSEYFAAKKIERVARAVKKTTDFENIFSAPRNLHRCKMRKKYYKNADTKYNCRLRKT